MFSSAEKTYTTIWFEENNLPPKTNAFLQNEYTKNEHRIFDCTVNMRENDIFQSTLAGNRRDKELTNRKRLSLL